MSAQPWWHDFPELDEPADDYIANLAAVNAALMAQALADRDVEIDLHALESWEEGAARDWDVTTEVPF